MKLKTINDIKNLNNKTVIVRLDLNVPIKENKIQDYTRINKSLPTLTHLLNNNAKIVIITHLGRPKGKIVEKLKVDILAKALEETIKHKVKKLDKIIGNDVQGNIKNMQPQDIILLENIRFDKREKENDENFSKELASYGDIYINDAFGTTHRKHASVEGITHFIDSYAGFLIEEEVRQMSHFRENKITGQTTLVIGGAKIKTKIGIITAFINKADNILLGGALANTFIKAQNNNIGNSLFEKDKVQLAKEIIKKAAKSKTKLLIPTDVVTALEISNTSKTSNKNTTNIEKNDKILDIGTSTQTMYKKIIRNSDNIIWNGPVGMSEYSPFRHGTETIATAISNNKNRTIIGGGDTIEAINHLKLPHSSFTHISTGGGASLEFLSGKEMPGLTTLYI